MTRSPEWQRLPKRTPERIPVPMSDEEEKGEKKENAEEEEALGSYVHTTSVIDPRKKSEDRPEEESEDRSEEESED